MKLTVYNPAENCTYVYIANEFSKCKGAVYEDLHNTLYKAIVREMPFYIEIDEQIFTEDKIEAIIDIIEGDYEHDKMTEWGISLEKFYNMLYPDNIRFLAIVLNDLIETSHNAYDMYMDEADFYFDFPNILKYFNNWYVFCPLDKEFYPPESIIKIYPELIKNAPQKIYNVNVDTNKNN